MGVCCVIDDAHADLLEEDNSKHRFDYVEDHQMAMSRRITATPQTCSCYPLPFHKAESRKDNGKHRFDYVEELEVWYEWDDCAYYDIWSWQKWEDWEEDVGPSEDAGSSQNVKHVQDSMVI